MSIIGLQLIFFIFIYLFIYFFFAKTSNLFFSEGDKDDEDEQGFHSSQRKHNSFMKVNSMS